MSEERENSVTAETIATELKTTADTVRAKARAGIIPGFKWGREWRFYPSQVRESLQPSIDPWTQPAASIRARRK